MECEEENDAKIKRIVWMENTKMLPGFALHQMREKAIQLDTGCVFENEGQFVKENREKRFLCSTDKPGELA